MPATNLLASLQQSQDKAKRGGKVSSSQHTYDNSTTHTAPQRNTNGNSDSICMRRHTVKRFTILASGREVWDRSGGSIFRQRFLSLSATRTPLGEEATSFFTTTTRVKFLILHTRSFISMNKDIIVSVQRHRDLPKRKSLYHHYYHLCP